MSNLSEHLVVETIRDIKDLIVKMDKRISRLEELQDD